MTDDKLAGWVGRKSRRWNVHGRLKSGALRSGAKKTLGRAEIFALPDAGPCSQSVICHLSFVITEVQARLVRSYGSILPSEQDFSYRHGRRRRYSALSLNQRSS